MKKYNILQKALSVLLSFAMVGVPLPTCAAAADTLRIEYTTEEKGIPGAEFKLYHVADIADGNQCVFLQEFSDGGFVVNWDATNAEWTELAEKLTEYVNTNNLQPVSTGTTREDGSLAFSGIDPGFYLVTGKPLEIGETIYTPQSVCVAVSGSTTVEPKFETSTPWLDSYAYFGEPNADMAGRTKTVIADVDTTITDEVYLSGLIPGEEYRLRSVIINDTYDVGYPVPAIFDGGTSREHHESGLGRRAEQLVLDIFEAWGIPWPKEMPPEGEIVESLRAGNILSGLLMETYAEEQHANGMWFDLPAKINEPEIDRILEDPANADLFKITAWNRTDFTATDTDMTLSTTYEHLNTTAKAGQNLRVFQILTKGDEIIATEVLAQYAAETVNVVAPELDTTATVNGSHESKPDSSVTLEDTITYKSVIPGKPYVMEGSIVEKSTGEVLATASTEFTADAPDGSVTQTFVLSAESLDGKSVVAYEKLLREGFVVTRHEDIDDADQTVTFLPKEPDKPKEPDNPGDYMGGASGKLVVSKTVTGAGDTNRAWNFKVTLSSPLSGQYGTMYFDGGISTFQLKHGESKTADKLPSGIKYTVEETDANVDGYQTTSTNASGSIIVNTTINVQFVNDLPEAPPDEEEPTQPTSEEDPKKGNITAEYTPGENDPDALNNKRDLSGAYVDRNGNLIFPKSGDSFNLVPILLACVISAAVIGCLVYRKKRKAKGSGHEDVSSEQH